MNRLYTALAGISAQLDGREIPWALVGGLAVSIRSEPRFTRDVDLAVAVDGDDVAEQLVRELRGDGYGVLETLEQEAAGRLVTTRLSSPGQDSEGVVVDLLFASSGIETEIAASADRIEILPGLEAPVASLAALIVLKLLARDDETRPQDAIDLKVLMALAGPEDLEMARHLAEQIEARRYHRGRDLSGMLERLRT